MTTKVIQAIWLACCAAVLILMQSDRSAEPEVWWLMILLTFPIGLLVTLVWGFVFFAAFEHYSIQLPDWAALLFALATVAAGFWQWFWLLPRIIRRVRRAV